MDKFMLNEIAELKKSSLISIGGIGSINISENKKYVFKMTFNVVAYINNIKTNTLLKKYNIPSTNLLNYFFIKYDNDIFKKFPNQLQILKSKNEYNNMDYVYILKYEAYLGNVYGLFSSLFFNIQSYLSETDNICYFKIWIYLILLQLNEFKIYHNDLKLDNILIQVNNNKYETVYINNFVIGNRTQFNYYLNDFDLSIEKKIFPDILSVLNSMNKLSILDSCESEIIKIYQNDVVLYHILNSKLSNEKIRKLIYVDITK